MLVDGFPFLHHTAQDSIDPDGLALFPYKEVLFTANS